jgi:hypothetical protein
MDGASALTHTVLLTATLSPDLVILAGASVVVSIEAACSSGCDLVGATVSLIGSATNVSGRLGRSAIPRRFTATISAPAPDQAGTHDWTVRLAPDAALLHTAASSVVIPVVAHPTSIQVWGVPAAVPDGRLVHFKVGLKCLAGCPMSRQAVAVVDDSGDAMATGHTGDEVWPGTNSLYYCEIAAIATAPPALIQWRARLVQQEGGPAHDDAQATFGFRVVPNPEHRLTVIVVEAGTDNTVQDVEVRCGPFVGYSDQTGRITFEVPPGTWEVAIRRDGFEATPEAVVVNSDLELRVQATRCVTREEWEKTLQPFKDVPWG